MTVFIGRPDSLRGIDLAAVAEHDAPPKAPNVVTSLAPLHALTPETLVAARGSWHPQFEHFAAPVGWRCCSAAISREGVIPPPTGASFSSRRWRSPRRLACSSPPAAVRRRRPSPWPKRSSTGRTCCTATATDKDNPYLGILACAEAFIVTGDSLSMVSEACVTGRPLFIFATPKVTPEQYRIFHQTLYKRGAARPLSRPSASTGSPLSRWTTRPRRRRDPRPVPTSACLTLCFRYAPARWPLQCGKSGLYLLRIIRNSFLGIRSFTMSVLVGKEAPDFTAKAVMGDNKIEEKFNLKSHIKGKIGILFFWPLDFTFVCPSEIIAFDNRVDESRNAAPR